MQTSAATPCNHVNIAKGPCVLELGHAGDHRWKQPEAQLDSIAQEVERELEREGGFDGGKPK